MKKRVIFLVLLLLGLIFFGCKFTIPTAIEIKGSPSVRFSENINIGEMFTGLFDEAFEGNETEGTTVFECENTDDFTFLVHMELFQQDFHLYTNEDDPDELPELPDFPGIELDDILGDLVHDQIVMLDNDRVLIKSEEPMEVPFSSIGNLLEGFAFDGHKIKLYFSGSDIVDKVLIDIDFDIKEDGIPVETYSYPGNSPDNKESDIETWNNNGYTAKTPPSDGCDIDLPLDGRDIAVSFKVYIPAGTELLLSDMQDGLIKIEVVVWLPFKMKAIVDGAEIKFPDDALFSSEDDLFGRDSPDAENMMTDYVESLSLEIVFDNNPFQGSDLIVWSKGIEIKNRLTGNSLPFAISEENMKKINNPDYFPFTPNFKMSFPMGTILRFPKKFNATDFIFKAKIKYRMDL